MTTRTRKGKAILCLFGFHRWDGHAESSYPAPKCTRCGCWHHRDIFNKDKP
jgi:hypothetical protein